VKCQNIADSIAADKEMAFQVRIQPKDAHIKWRSGFCNQGLPLRLCCIRSELLKAQGQTICIDP
jgi:hypothetical protein